MAIRTTDAGTKYLANRTAPSKTATLAKPGEKLAASAEVQKEFMVVSDKAMVAKEYMNDDAA